MSIQRNAINIFCNKTMNNRWSLYFTRLIQNLIDPIFDLLRPSSFVADNNDNDWHKLWRLRCHVVFKGLPFFLWSFHVFHRSIFIKIYLWEFLAKMTSFQAAQKIQCCIFWIWGVNFDKSEIHQWEKICAITIFHFSRIILCLLICVRGELFLSYTARKTFLLFRKTENEFCE